MTRSRLSRLLSVASFYGKTLNAYRESLEAAGLPRDESLVSIVEKSDSLHGYIAAGRLLEIRPRVTALVTARDALAIGACRRFTEAGLAIGHDMSVIGFDNLGQDDASSFLTTFDEPCPEMGAVAAEMLIERIVNGWHPPEKREIEARLILRRSAGPLPAPQPVSP